MLLSLKRRAESADRELGQEHRIANITDDLSAAFQDKCLLKGAGTLSGVVTSAADGSPVSGATVLIVGANGNQVKTNELGQFSITNDAGTYPLEISAGGFATTRTVPLALAAGARLENYAIELLTTPPGHSISGTVVRSEDGLAVAGAVVSIGTSNQATTDGSGHFSLTQPAGSYQLAISAAGFATPAPVQLALLANANLWTGPIKLFQAPGLTTITGTVQTAGGAPIAAATVLIEGPPLYQTTTDALGNFTLSVAPDTYRLQVSAAGFAGTVAPPLNAPALTVAARGTATAGTITLSPAALGPDPAVCAKALGDTLRRDIDQLRQGSGMSASQQAFGVEVVATLYATYAALGNQTQLTSPPPPTQYTLGKLTRFAFSLGVAGILKTDRNTPAKIGMVNGKSAPIPDNPTAALTFVALDIACRRYDETRYSLSPAERSQWFVGIALTPDPGVVAGYAFGIVRGLSLQGGYAALLANTLVKGEHINVAPTSGTPVVARRTLGAYFLGLSYSFQ